MDNLEDCPRSCSDIFMGAMNQGLFYHKGVMIICVHAELRTSPCRCLQCELGQILSPEYNVGPPSYKLVYKPQ